MLRGKFETGSNGTFAWLNDVVGVGVLKRNGTSAVGIEMCKFVLMIDGLGTDIVTGHATPGS